MSTEPLPSFENPPVGEVAVSLQFERLERLTSIHLAELWQSFKQDFPVVEEQPPLPQVREELRSGPAAPPLPEIRLSGGMVVPRFVFLDPAGGRLFQVQQDRFVHNWRRQADEPYPRYVELRSAFVERLLAFREFVAGHGVGDILPNQCELTCVNPIAPGVWERHGQLDRVVTVWQNSFSDAFLTEPQDVRFLERHWIRDSRDSVIGRLYIQLDPIYHLPTGEPRLLLQLIARGAPLGAKLNDAMAFLDIAHEWIVRGFTSITQPEMHEVWGREH
jgi:uncharacterized protein (TIGR04255 family)